MNKLEQLKKYTKVVADTGDFAQIKQFQPKDATTNPSLILNAVQNPACAEILDQVIAQHKDKHGQAQIDAILMGLNVAFGQKITEVVPGLVSTEVDARLSFDTQATIDYAKALIAQYQQVGIDRSRVLIKIASTWEGIKAAEVLEKEGIHCNLTLMFDIAQAIACAQAGVYLISPFVGRITDWYMAQAKQTDFPPIDQDQGVTSVKNIYQHYKAHGYQTVVMGASFRHVGQVEALAGCDALTIAPKLLEQLQQDSQVLTRALEPTSASKKEAKMTENDFRWAMNESAMATEKLAEGIRKFAEDTRKLEAVIKAKVA